METFKASTGTLIELTNAGKTGYMLAEGDESGATGYLGFEQMVAWREFFLHERDQELGRWRWPVNPEYVVYPKERSTGGKRIVRVVSEANGYGCDYYEGTNAQNDHRRAASAYFDAHPEPKPWHDAKDGQLWLIRFADFHETDVSALVKDSKFIYNDHCHDGVAATNDPALVSARRIWPEVVSDGA